MVVVVVRGGGRRGGERRGAVGKKVGVEEQLFYWARSADQINDKRREEWGGSWVGRGEGGGVEEGE